MAKQDVDELYSVVEQKGGLKAYGRLAELRAETATLPASLYDQPERANAPTLKPSGSEYADRIFRPHSSLPPAIDLVAKRLGLPRTAITMVPPAPSTPPPVAKRPAWWAVAALVTLAAFLAAAIEAARVQP